MILKKRIAIQYSLPKWIVDHWVTHFGVEKTENIARSFLEPVTTTVRANISRDSIDSIISKLEQEGYHVKKRRYVTILSSYIRYACG